MRVDKSITQQHLKDDLPILGGPWITIVEPSPRALEIDDLAA